MKTLNNIFLLVLICITFSCTLFVDEHRVRFECGKPTLIELKPSNSTHKCKIELIQNSCKNDSILIYSNGDLQADGKFSTAELGLLLNRDWYVGILGIEYKAEEANVNTEGSNVVLDVNFYK